MLENRSSKFNLLIFSLLPRYVCNQEPKETDEILVALDMSKDIGAKLQQVLDKLGEMDKKLKVLWRTWLV